MADATPSELMASSEGDELHFGAPGGLDVTALGARLGATVTDISEPFHPEEGAYAHSHGEAAHALLNR